MSTNEPGSPGDGVSCPLPITDHATIQLAHGAGGRLTQTLIERLFLRSFDNQQLRRLHDGALLEVNGSRLAFSTDSFVIHPLFFPGGDIGSLAVHGTVNDLAMCGARPVGLSVGLIIEEGLAMEDLWRITCSIAESAEAVGVPVVTGDTKVVDRGKGDGLFINTTGVGEVARGVDVSPSRAAPGDVVLINGGIAVHGVAILSVREGLEFGTRLESDSAPLHDLVQRVLARAGEAVHVLRDPTRGGVASALNEIAGRAGVGIRLDERSLPVREEVRAACDLLGLDPLDVANEGKCLVIAAREIADDILQTMRDHPQGREAEIVGEVVDDHPGRVTMRSVIGGTRIVDMPSGDPLPRIC
jgi:hydrogenase expression/formation protein HypE